MSDEEKPKTTAEDEEKLLEEKKARAEKVRKRREEVLKKLEEDEANEPVTPTKKETPKLREDLINSSVNFLNHPKVVSSATEHKKAFLTKKGLTEEEIKEAFRRVGESDGSNTSSSRGNSASGLAPQRQVQYQNRAAPLALAPPPPPPPPAWYQSGSGLALLALGCVGVGVGVTALAKYLIPYLSGEDIEKEAALKKKREEEEEKRATDQKLMMEMMNSLKAMQEKNDLAQENFKNMFLQQQQNNMLQQAAFNMNNEKKKEDSMSKSDKMRLQEMEAELKRFKAMDVDRRNMASLTNSQGSWTPNTKPSIPSWQMTPPTTQNSSSSTPQTSSESNASPRVEEFVEEKKVEREEPKKENVTGGSNSKFDAIVQMVSSGKTPDDIKDIDDKPRDPNHKIEKGARESPLKPWERKQNASNESESPEAQQ